VETTVVLRGALFVTLELLGTELLGTVLETLELLGTELLGTELLGALFETLELLGVELLDELESSEPRPCLAEAGLISTAVVAASPTATMAAALNIRRVLFAVFAVVVAVVLMFGSLVWRERFCSRRSP
jgi:hypothetical protein